MLKWKLSHQYACTAVKLLNGKNKMFVKKTTQLEELHSEQDLPLEETQVSFRLVNYSTVVWRHLETTSPLSLSHPKSYLLESSFFNSINWWRLKTAQISYQPEGYSTVISNALSTWFTQALKLFCQCLGSMFLCVVCFRREFITIRGYVHVLFL